MAKKKAGKAPKAAKGNLPSPSLPGHKSPGNAMPGKGFAKMGKGKKEAC